MEMTCFFCSDFEESGAMQRMALFLNLARKVVADGRPLTESTMVGWDRDARVGGEQRLGGGQSGHHTGCLGGHIFYT